MKLLIQCNLMNESSLLEIKEGICDLPHEFISIIPFTREIISDYILEGTDYIPYGSTKLTKVAFEDYSWKGTFFDIENFNYEKCIQKRKDMLNCDHVFSVKEALEFFSKCQKDEGWFVRPSLDLKQFSGMVINSDECRSWLENAVKYDSSESFGITEDTMIVVSEPKIIQAEFRWFIVGRKLISGSMYRKNNILKKERITEKNFIKKVQMIIDDSWIPNDCCVMDLALVDSELKVIEFNCINSSGFYDHSIKEIFSALYDFTINF
jgi:hypothetical protein